MKTKFLILLILSSVINESSAGASSSPEALCDFFSDNVDDIISVAYKNISIAFTTSLDELKNVPRVMQVGDYTLVIRSIYTPWMHNNYPVINETIDEISKLFELSHDYVMSVVENREYEAVYPLSCVIDKLRYLDETFINFVHLLEKEATTLVSSLVMTGLARPQRNEARKERS